MTITDRPMSHQLEPFAETVRFDEESMRIELAHGGELVVPLAWFPSLAKLSRAALEKYELVDENTVIHWHDPVDEWLSVAGLLGQPD